MSSTDKVVILPTYVSANLPVFVVDVNYLRPQLELARIAIDELRASYPGSIESNVRATYTSPWKSHMLNQNLLPLCDSMAIIAKECSRIYLSSNIESLNLDLVVVDCWGIIYEYGDHTEVHNHFPATFGCAVYLESDERGAPIVFDGGAEIKPKSGMALVFPGVMNHHVPANEGHRVVVAMNMYTRAVLV